MWIESRGNHTKNGKVIENAWGFTGFMQLGKHFGEGRFDPQQNLSMGAKFLNDSCFRSSTPPRPPKRSGQGCRTPDECAKKWAVGMWRAGGDSPGSIPDRPWVSLNRQPIRASLSYLYTPF